MNIEDFTNQYALKSWRESEKLEWKLFFGEHKEIVQTVAAFANTCGGVVVVGVADDGKVIGQDFSDATLRQLSQTILANTQDKVSFNPFITSLDGKNVLIIEVPESPLKPHLAYGRALKRVGSTVIQIEQSEYHLMLGRKQNGGGADREACEGVSLSEIDETKLQKFVLLANERRNTNYSIYVDPLQLLQSLELASAATIFKGAVLLFGKNPQKFIPQAEIRMALFKDNSRGIFLNQKIAEGDLFEQLQVAMTFVDFAVPTMIDTNLIGDRVRRPISPRAIQELVANALVHRDYRSQASSYINITANSELEIKNPGTLPAPEITPENLHVSHASIPINRRIARVFFLAGLIEQWGEGTSRVSRDLKQAGLPAPKWESRDGTVRVAVRFA